MPWNKPTILYRRGSGPEDEAEIEAIQQAELDLTFHRSDVHLGDLVVGRYSVLPFYKELEEDLDCYVAKLINSYQQHQYVADLKNWYQDLEELTPKTYFRLEDVPVQGGPFVLKGETNSRKDRWNDMMFAKDKKAAVEVGLRLQADGLIGTQKLIIREFEPFVKLGTGIGGAPVTKEYRFFILDGKILCGGFYWSGHLDLLPNGDTKPPIGAYMFLQYKVIPKIQDKIRFVVVDLALHEDGRWRVVELNDGQMSGLSTIDPNELYQAISCSCSV